jgi:hypothetical protein
LPCYLVYKLRLALSLSLPRKKMSGGQLKFVNIYNKRYKARIFQGKDC